MSMVQTIEISKAEFLEKYARKAIEDPLGPVTVGTEQRVYGRTTEGQAGNPDGFIVVYAVL